MREVTILYNRVKCPICHGSGEVPCPICRGEGRDYRTALFGVPCPKTVRCENCSGTGYVKIN